MQRYAQDAGKAPPQERENNREAAISTLYKDTVLACEKFGAYEVRKAAIRQQKGDDKALEEVGLAHHAHKYEDLLDISTIAFHRMTGEEILDEFYSKIEQDREDTNL